MKLIIMGKLRSYNDYIDEERRSRYHGAKARKEDELRIMWWAKKSLRGWKARGPVYMRYTWYEPNRRRDKSNICGYGRKVIEDALVKAGYLKGDGWAHIAGFSDEFAVDKTRPRIEVEIEEVTGIETRGN